MPEPLRWQVESDAHKTERPQADPAPEAEPEQVTTLEESPTGEKRLDFERPAEPVRSAAVKGLFILALLYTFYLARTFLLPVLIALIGTFVLAPMVRWLKLKWRLPEAVGSAGILLLTAGLVVYPALLVSEPFINWLNDAPAVIERIQHKLRGPIQNVTRATEKISKATEPDPETESGAPVVKVRDAKPGWGETLLTWGPFILGNAAITVILLFFFLAYGDLFLLKVVKVMPTFSDKKNAVEIAHKIESQVSSYLATITLINIGLGVAIGFAMALWGMPTPALWGVMAAVLNFIPYIGALIGLTVTALVAFTHFDSLSYGFFVPLTYFLLTSSEGYFVTPILLGRRLILNPVVIFLGLVFWGWMWSVPGMLLAVPILVVFKIFCDHIKPLEPVGEFLGR